MKYREFDIDTWKRKEQYMHFKDMNYSLSFTANIDITKFLKAINEINKSFYIAFLYCVCKVINAHEEFRLFYRWQDDKVILWDEVYPAHIVFHKDSETITRIYSEWNQDFFKFYRSCLKDMVAGRKVQGYNAPNIPENVFEATYIPWFHYSSANIMIPKDWISFVPIVAWGKHTEDGGRTILPLSMQAHHAVADGFQIARFFNETETVINELAEQLLDLNEKVM